MPKLAEILFRILDMPVVDRTGTEGVFDFSLDWAMERRPSLSAAEGGDNPPAENAGPTIFTVLDELWVEIYALRELRYHKLMKRAKVVPRPFIKLARRTASPPADC